MAKTTPGRGIRIPLSETSWKLVLQGLDILILNITVGHEAVRLKDYIERKLAESLQQR